jgi:hypothetical protein
MESRNPENPSSVPAIIYTLLSMAKPVAAEASPAYEFIKDITTGISAAPMGNTIRTPERNAQATIT